MRPHPVTNALLRAALSLGLVGWLSGPPRTGAQAVSVWLTTDDQHQLLQAQAPVSFAPGSPGTNCVLVDESQTYQQVEGFGAAFTDTTGYTLNELARPAARTNALRDLFSRQNGGIGLSFMRIPMGASDLARFLYSYDDLPSGQTDPALALFSIAHDQVDIIPLIQQARQLNPQLKLMANPWSPPGWMKSSGSMIGGSLLPSTYGPFANYFVRFIQAYQAEGLPIDYISLQNEPLYVPGDYPGMDMDAATQTAVLRDYVLPALAANQLSTRVLVYDHNWDRADYPDSVLSDPTILASAQVAGSAWHGYGGTPGVMLSLAAKYPLKGNYQTEHSGGTWVGDQVRTDFEEIIQAMRSWARSFVKWNLAGDQNDGPHNGGCGTCTPLVVVNSSSGSTSYSVDYYTLGHFSKFVLPGAYRIYSANASGIVSAAFLNPDGSKALVAFNDTAASNGFQVQWGGQAFTYALPAYSGATFTWTGTQSGSPAQVPTNQLCASSFNSVSGLQTEQSSDTQGGYDVGYAQNGGYALFKGLDFAGGFTNVAARLASGGSGGTLEFHLDNPSGPMAGLLSIPVTGGWQNWQTVTGLVSGGSGVHDLYLVLKGSSGSIANLNWFQYSGQLPAVPAPWTSVDVGAVSLAGRASVSGAGCNLSGSGDDIWNSADAFHFLEQPASGACELRARVASVQNTDPWAKAGLMIRASTDPGAVNVALVLTAANGLAWQVRTNAGGTTTSTVIGGLAAPRWLRLVRSADNSFSAFYSLDGNIWTQIGSTVKLALSSNAVLGLAVTAHNNTTNCAAAFDNVTVNQAPVLAAPADQNLVAGATLTLSNSATDPDIPAQSLTFRLLSAPAGASLDSSSGVLRWRPAIAQSATTSLISLAVSDSGIPSMAATQSFTVTVSTPARPTLGAPALTNGQYGLWLQGDAGPDYTIEVSTNLRSWNPLTTLTPAVLPCLWLDTNSAASPCRFYRVLLGP